MNWYWLLYIPLGGLGIVGVITAIIVASKYKKSTPPAVAAGTTPVPPSRISDWLKSGKIWSGLGFWLLINGAVWFFHHYASQYFTVYNPWPLFLAVNVVVGLWVIAIFRETTGWGKFFLFLASWFLIGSGLAFYEQSPAEFKAQAAANEARQSSDPFTKVIAEVEVPPGVEDELVWSEAIVLPDPNGPQFRARLTIPTAVKVYDPDGKELSDRAIKDSREDRVNFYGLPNGSSAQFASLIPGQGGTLQFLVKE